MTDESEAPPVPDPDLHEAFSQSISAILRMHFSASRRIDAEQNAEVKRRAMDSKGGSAL
jgi:hypothetical protein